MYIDHPLSTDVLCGKDKTYETHPGNQLYRELIISTAYDYAITTSKQGKMKMTRNIVSKLISDHKSRFLKYSTMYQTWEELSMAAARDKTSHALRFYVAQQQQQQHLHTDPISVSSTSSSSSSKSKSKKVKRTKLTKTKSIMKRRRTVSFDGLPSLYNGSIHKTMDDTTMTCYVIDKNSNIQSIYHLDGTTTNDNQVQQQTPDCPDWDTLWSYHLQDNDEFALIQEYE